MPSRAPPTVLICDRIRVQGQETCSTVFRQTTSSRCSPDFSERCSWRSCASLWTSPMHNARVRCSIDWDVTRAACARSGRLKTRALPTERTVGVCREAGATVRRDWKLQDVNISVRARDERAIEVLPMGLPIQQGAQSAVNTTLRSALTATVEPCPRVCNHGRSGGPVSTTPRRSEMSCWKVIVAVLPSWWRLEVGSAGRLSSSLMRWQWQKPARRSAHLAWRRPWMRTLAISCDRSFAASLVAGPSDVWSGTNGCAQDLGNLFLEM